MKMRTENHNENNIEILYVIEVHGYAPEFWPAVAFRRNGGKGKKQPEEAELQKEIKCPYCGKLFMVVSIKRKLDLVRFTARVKVECHEYRKCKKCRENIGIVYFPESA
jgi:ssDNA-binding Zn-finger/Zn-ribbon topoisomerase 1